ncbi:MAG: hypothetical protein IKD36_00945 [Clostridia bacterium]|nr:hypothetical protein [Clostridia bacterium]
MSFDRFFIGSCFSDEKIESLEDLISEKNRIISVQERDMESLKREIVELKKQLNYSKQKKK